MYSNIHSSVFYKDQQTIDPEDVGHPATLFQMQLFGKMVLIVFGKVKHTFIDRNVVFFPIYLVSGGKIVGQIGLVEMHKNKVISLLQEDGDLDIENIDPPLLYDFVSEAFIDRSGSDAEEFVLQKERGAKQDDKQDDKPDDKHEDLSDEEDEVMKIKVPKEKLSPEIEKASETLDAGIFTKDAHIVPPSPLQEETKEEVATYKAEFKKHPSQAWIAKFMKNNGFAIHEVEANGDCFFAVVRDAYRQVGQITTVAKLRAILAKEATEEIFEDYRGLYLALDATVRENEKEMERISDTIKNNLKKRARKVRDQPEELQRILDQIKELETEFKTLQEQRRETQDLIDTSVGSMKNIQTLEQFREFIQTPKFWANEWAISVLERVLQMKVVIFSQRSYLEENYDNIMNCGMVDKDVQAAKQFAPKFYIMTTYSGDHYRLITYKDKRIFVFHELPMHIKTLVINKCMERNAGAFALITEFRNLKSKIGLEKEGADTEDSDDGTNDGSEEDTDLYTKKIRFVFHISGNVSTKPGKVSGELIPEKERANFIDLGRMKEWRRKLDDAWTDTPFKVQDKKWASVEHYYQGAKFKKHFPDFMAQFSLDSDSEISKDVDLARIAGSKTGQPTSAKDKKKVRAGMSLRPSGVAIDPDFYGERSEQERETALQAKFGQNADMRQLLLATKNAKLVHFLRGAEGETDHLLMKVRHDLAR